MPSFNKVILAGNLTRDPEPTTTPKGTVIAAFGLAINREAVRQTENRALAKVRAALLPLYLDLCR
jgi:single-stranded DNA-binding protein